MKIWDSVYIFLLMLLRSEKSQVVTNTFETLIYQPVIKNCPNMFEDFINCTLAAVTRTRFTLSGDFGRSAQQRTGSESFHDFSGTRFDPIFNWLNKHNWQNGMCFQIVSQRMTDVWLQKHACIYTTNLWDYLTLAPPLNQRGFMIT